MKVVHKCEYRGRMRIDPGLHFDPGVSRQCQPDNEQQDDERDDAVQEFLHAGIVFNVAASPQYNAPMISPDATCSIGVFDSGVGGLTVLKALHAAMPHENLVYLGDTARLPYGTKSPASIARYACQAAALLRQRDIKLLVVACNTASAVALEELREQMLPLPVIGVVDPGAAARARQPEMRNGSVDAWHQRDAR